MIKKIVVIGPESTGKSTLCAQLATHYDTLWVPEYAREYLEQRNATYKYEDLAVIARRQLEQEDEMLTQAKQMNAAYLFIDTDMYVMKVWSEFVFNKCENEILKQIARRQYDGYLLCDVDLPWVRDELREYPDIETRRKLFLYYKEHLVSQQTPWCHINGGYDERKEKAIAFANILG